MPSFSLRDRQAALHWLIRYGRFEGRGGEGRGGEGGEGRGGEGRGGEGGEGTVHTFHKPEPL